MRLLAPLCSMLLLASACGADDGARDRGAVGLELAVGDRSTAPAGAECAAPALHAGADGRLHLVWIEPAGTGRSRLLHAARDGAAWTPPETVAEGADWFVNWADVPAVSALADGSLVATWLPKSGSGTYAYDAVASGRPAGAERWTAPVKLHSDDVEGEHGFVSLVPWGEGFAAVWLDGRETGGAEDHAGGHAASGAMTLRARTVSTGGALGAELLLDERVCDCCPTATVGLADGRVLVAYRDRSPEEVRDIAFVAGRPDEEDSWSEPRPVHADGWHFPGCPVNGPALAAAGERVAAAWFTMAPETDPRVLVAFADARELSFGEPLRVDGGEAHGRVEAVFLAPDRLLVAWLDATGSNGAWHARIVAPDGRMGAPVTVAEVSLARRSGRARLARVGEGAVLAWPSEAGIELATLELSPR